MTWWKWHQNWCWNQGRNLLFLPQKQDFQTQDFLISHPSRNTFILHNEDVQMKRSRVGMPSRHELADKKQFLNVRKDWIKLTKNNSKDYGNFSLTIEYHLNWFSSSLKIKRLFFFLAPYVNYVHFVIVGGVWGSDFETNFKM